MGRLCQKVIRRDTEAKEDGGRKMCYMRKRTESDIRVRLREYCQ